jgi:hypothetical protein
MFEHPAITAISAAIILVVGGFTVRAWLAQAKREGMTQILDIFKEQIGPHYDDHKLFPEELGWAFIHLRSDLAGAWTDVGRIAAFEKHCPVIAAKMGEACVERGKRLALLEVRSGV